MPPISRPTIRSWPLVLLPIAAAVPAAPVAQPAPAPLPRAAVVAVIRDPAPDRHGRWATLGTGVNASGQVAVLAGQVRVVGDGRGLETRYQVFVTGAAGVGVSRVGPMTIDHRQPGGYDVRITTTGAVASSRSTAPGGGEAFLTGAGGKGFRRLGFLWPASPQRFSEAHGVNDRGQVTGTSYSASRRPEAFLTGPDGRGMRGLGVLYEESSPHAAGSQGVAVNASGQVTGVSAASADRAEAFLTGPDGRPMRGLGSLAPGAGSYGSAVNDAGQVTGWSTDAAGNQQAFLTGPNGAGMRSLGIGGGVTPGGGSSMQSAGYGVNADGTVVGAADGVDPGAPPGTPARRRAFVYTAASGMQFIEHLLAAGGAPGWRVESATAITDNGYVLAEGAPPGTTGADTRVLLLRVTPPPRLPR